ncbi:MAG: hypothetical protein GY926_00475 [bacterium]|nr:hypothetical protein [bacterium]
MTLLSAQEDAAYADTWRRLVTVSSGVDDEAFEDQVEILHARASVLNDALVFQVWFRYRIGWAVVDGANQFLLERAETRYIPRVQADFRETRLLPPGTVEAEIDQMLYNGQLLEIDPEIQVRFEDCETAAAFAGSVTETDFEPFGITTSPPYGVSAVGSHLYLSGFGQPLDQPGSCKRVHLDLVTGETYVDLDPSSGCEEASASALASERRARYDGCTLLIYHCPVMSWD